MVENFINQYLYITRRLESPTSYLKWGAISCLSAVMKNNIYFTFPDRQQKVFPNLYVLIIGDTAQCRKSNPFDINERLLRGDNGVNNTKIIAGQATMQGVIRTLAEVEANGIPKGGSGYLLAREAGSFFIQDPQTLGLLTQMYNYHPLFDKSLAGFDIPVIKDLCLSIMAGTNEIMFEKILDRVAMEGGFLGRCIVIKETERRLVDSGFGPDREKAPEDVWVPCQIFLKRLATIKGPITFDAEAAERFHQWYTYEFDPKPFQTKTGYEWRVDAMVQKLSMIFSANEAGFNGQFIKLPALEMAISETVEIISNYKQMTLGKGIAPDANYNKEIVDMLLKAKEYKLTRTQLLQKLYGNINGKIFDDIMVYLDNAQYVRCFSSNGVVAYQLTDLFLELCMNKNSKAKTNHHGP